MKTLTAALLASAFIAAPALACPGMSAENWKPMTTAQAPEKSEEAMSTFDPQTKPVFAEEAAEETVPDAVEVNE